MKLTPTLLACLLAIPAVCTAQLPALQELRYCGPVKREKTGEISRRDDVLSAFKRAHPCPANSNTRGACPGWAIDHVIPLACGGCDAVSNLQWLPNVLKSAAVVGKDRFERKIYEKDIACKG